jgi:hypothetical protein
MLLMILCAGLAGCGLTAQGDLVRSAVDEKGGEVMDEGLANAEWFICNAASIGAVRRRYGRSPDLAAAYRTLCDRDSNI